MAARLDSDSLDSSPVALRTLAARLRHPLVDRDGALGSLTRVCVTPEPYQVESVHRIVSAPRARILLADDVGLGKTVQAGLCLAELAARGRARRVLVVVPAALRAQWLEEMAEKFGERFHVYDSAMVRRLRRQLPADANPWQYHARVLTSLDYLKRTEVADEVTAADWDCVIVDEAHKLGCHLVNGRIQRTARYRAVERLAEASDACLLMTATPHSGDETAFQGLLALLDPFLLAEEGQIPAGRLRGLMIRRGKGEIRDAKGRPTFTPRRVQTVEVRFRADEWALYEATTEYIREQYRAAKASGDVVGGFAMVLLQKRLVSSVWALRESLRRRLDALHQQKSERLAPDEVAGWLAASEAPEDADDAALQTAAAVEARLERYRTKGSDAPDEAVAVERLLGMADAVLRTGDSKVRALKTFVDGIRAEAPDEKLLVFTEYRDTLEYLARALAPHPVARIHGGVPMDDRRRIVAEFNAPGSGVLLATDAAGEGLNMQQRCHLMVNYELPWNPNRIDQRIGRLHRYGQRREVRVWNLQVADTREGLIFDLLTQKVRTMEKALGGKVSEVLGAVLRDVRLPDLLMDALAADEPPAVTRRHLERAIAERQKMVETVERGFAAALPGFDAPRAAALAERHLAGRPGAPAVRELVARFAASCGGELVRGRHSGSWSLRGPVLGKVPAPIEVAFDRATADRTGATFLHAGHPWVEAAVTRVMDGLPADAPEVLGVPGGPEADALWCLFRVKIREAGGGEECALLPVRVSPEGHVASGREIALPPAAPPPAAGSPPGLRAVLLGDHAETLLAKASQAAAEVVKHLARRRRDERTADVRPLEAARSRYVEAKEAEIGKREAALTARAEAGEDVAIALRAEAARRKALARRVARDRESLDRRADVAPCAPELLTWALLVGVPAPAQSPRETPSGMFPALA